MTFTRIAIAGAGTMGSQVGWQMAFHGKQVTVSNAIPAGLEKGRACIGSTRAFPDRTRRDPDANRRRPRSPRLHHRPGDGGAGCGSNQRVVAESMPIKESFWREASARPGARRVHHQHLDPDASALAASSTGRKVPRPALCGRRLGRQHRRGHGTSRYGPAVFDRVLKLARKWAWCPSPFARSRTATSSTA